MPGCLLLRKFPVPHLRFHTCPFFMMIRLLKYRVGVLQYREKYKRFTCYERKSTYYDLTPTNNNLSPARTIASSSARPSAVFHRYAFIREVKKKTYFESAISSQLSQGSSIRTRFRTSRRHLVL